MWKRSPIGIRSYTFRANPPLNRETPCSTYTFPHVLCDPPAESCKRPTGSSPNGGQSGCGSNVNGCPSGGHSERGFHRNGISLPSCVLFAIWGVCPQMAISDTCRHVPDTFLHVPMRADMCRYVSDTCQHVPTRAGHMAGCSCLGFRMTLSCMCGCPVGSYSLRAATHSHLPIMSIEFAFPCILCSPRIGWLKLRPLSIHSFTFRATLPLDP